MPDITNFVPGEWSTQALTSDTIVQARYGQIRVSTSGGSSTGIILKDGDTLLIGAGMTINAKSDSPAAILAVESTSPAP